VNVPKLSEAADARVAARFQATVSADGILETFPTASLILFG
jgi:hypothetical protein